MEQLGVLSQSFACDICIKTFQTHYHLLNYGKVYIRGINKFVCAPCGRATQVNMAPIKHKVIKTTDERQALHICGICDKSFVYPNHLKAHQRVHTNEKPFKCEVCNKAFSQNSNLKVHMTVHTGERRFKCSHCDMTFRQKVQLLEHETIHSKLRPFVCEQCGKDFRLKKDLVYHTRRTHAGEGAFSCGKCGKCFHRMGLLKRHEIIHYISSEKRPHKCHLCNKGFLFVGDLKVHLRVHTGKGRYKCNQCSLSFRTTNHLFYHKKLHPVEVPYKCNNCNLIFKRVTLLQQHEKLHTGERPFGCKFCGKAYKSKHYLDQHETVTHEVDASKKRHEIQTERHEKQPESGQQQVAMVQLPPMQELPIQTAQQEPQGQEDQEDVHVQQVRRFKCRHCDQTFSQKVQLLEHETIHSKLHLFICEQCGKDFRLKKDLVHHTRCTHASEGTFSCGKCGKCFHRMGQLKRHEIRHNTKSEKNPCEKLHTKECPFGCKICRKAFKFKHYLNKHEKIAHKVKGSKKQNGTQTGVHEEQPATLAQPPTGQNQAPVVQEVAQAEQLPPVQLVPVQLVPVVQPQETAQQTSQGGIIISEEQPFTARAQQLPTVQEVTQDKKSPSHARSSSGDYATTV